MWNCFSQLSTNAVFRIPKSRHKKYIEGGNCSDARYPETQTPFCTEDFWRDPSSIRSYDAQERSEALNKTIPTARLNPWSSFHESICVKRKESSEATSLLSSEWAAFSKSGLATSGLAEDCWAAGADDDGLCVWEDGRDSKATWALDIHEKRSRSWDKVLELVFPSLSSWAGIEKVDCENHLDGLESNKVSN